MNRFTPDARVYLLIHPLRSLSLSSGLLHRRGDFRSPLKYIPGCQTEMGEPPQAAADESNDNLLILFCQFNTKGFAKPDPFIRFVVMDGINRRYPIPVR